MTMDELVSIHAPRVGSDHSPRWQREVGVGFNPRSPRGERPTPPAHPVRHIVFQSTLPAHPVRHIVFQSTLPAWGATFEAVQGGRESGVSIHAPRVGSDVPPRLEARPPPHVSIHAPRVGSDPDTTNLILFETVSIHAPRVGSDSNLLVSSGFGKVSIHAPRVGSDVHPARSRPRLSRFNPRSPRGERQNATHSQVRHAMFQSTLPAWGATRVGQFSKGSWVVSIHAPRVGSDSPSTAANAVHPSFNPRSPRGERSHALLQELQPIDSFNPRSPRGERPCGGKLEALLWWFQSTLPAWGATQGDGGQPGQQHVSIHAPRVGSDRRRFGVRPLHLWFQSTLPAWGATLPETNDITP